MTVFDWIPACSPVEADPPPAQIWDMRSHGGEGIAALQAVIHGDLDAIHRAGEALARPDPAPGLPEPGREPLAQVRESGRLLANAADLPAAAVAVVGSTEGCAACHLAFALQEPRSDGDPSALLWAGLVFESEVAWQRATNQLRDRPSLAAARDWATRRQVLALSLTDGRW